MLNILGSANQLCDRVSRRRALAVGGLSSLGLSLPDLLRNRQASAAEPADTVVPAGAGGGKAKSCIVLFMLGGPPQHSTWDPKPEAPREVRGEFGGIPTATPGVSICELMPRTALESEKILVLRAMSSNDNAHSSSGYYMHTGQPHSPTNFENANPGPPNDHPCLGAVTRRLRGEGSGLPPSITLPHHIFNTDGSFWPGQTAGMLGRANDPWLLKFDPAEVSRKVEEFGQPDDLTAPRLESRRSLLAQVNRALDGVERGGAVGQFDRFGQRAFDLLGSSPARQAFDLDRESPATRDRYGRTPFGNCVLLARRLVEAGVSLVQVNWYRGPDEPAPNPCWDSHWDEAKRLKNVLMGPMDQAYSALLEDLGQRGMLDETLVSWMAEFGRSPKFNPVAGRDHWGYVYSAALAGGGIRGGQVIGSSDRLGGQPREGRVRPEDLTATIYHALGYHADTVITDATGRPHPISRGQIIPGAF